jgi:hypothetical protein
MLHWVVQNNIYSERGYDVVLKTIERFEFAHTYVKVVPFSHELVPAVEVEGPKIVLGSITLGNVAVQRGWAPGAFTNENFDYPRWRAGYGDHLLSPDLKVCRYADVAHDHDVFFIRPCGDDKTFSGNVTNWGKFCAWRKKVIKLGETYTTLDADTMVAYGEPKEIYQECRFYVVRGRVITGSQYKLGRRVVLNEDVPPFIWDFAQAMADLWQPHPDAFALDIADTPDGPKVIEIGCMNSAGFYASDVQLLLLTLQHTDFDT